MSGGAVRPVAVRGQRVIDPAAWTASDLAGNDNWIVRLDDRDIAGLREVAANFRRRYGDDANGLLERDRSDFDLRSFHGKLKAIAHALKDGKGLVLVRGLPIHRLEAIDVAIIYWAIGLHLGLPASNNPDGDMIGHVTDLGKDRHHPKHRGYQTRATMDYHNDQANVVGLLCVRTSKHGGESKVVSSISVYNELIRRRPDLLDTLCGDFCWSMMGEVDEDESPYYTSPVFNFLEGFLCTSFGPDHMRKGHNLPEAPDLTPGQSESIRVVEEICEDLHYPMELQVGDIQFLNNMVALHTRNGFKDWPEPERKRLLWRLWLTVPGIRPLTPFMEHWRTGLLLKRTEPRINLRPG
ncbi:MAG: TauD/TfdA family dioxygenase [Rhodospirillaceae bacterium]|nr:TauD/TfdA family dioxygenase [Rhodospirillaceae bacterium]MDE0361631.1 TauD/TfdA family dioxygenase [Rhodospirillaceae bacterium]